MMVGNMRYAVETDRITVVPRDRDAVRLGDPSSERRDRARRDLGLDPADEVIVNMGRQDYQKGQQYLVEVAALLAPECPRLKVVVAGKEGRMTPELEQLRATLDIGETVRFLGNRPEVPEVLAAGDAFAFPSLHEEIGGAVIEAMALGLPVVCSDIASLREVVEPGGSAFLVPPEDPRSLATTMTSVLDARSLARRLGEGDRTIFLERFSLERGAAGMARLYRSMIDQLPDCT